MLFRGDPGPWSASIGYQQVQMRHDPNFLEQPPPFWPELEWIDADPPSFELSPHAQESCGLELTGEEFLPAWQERLLSLRITPHPDTVGGRKPVRLSSWLDGTAIETRLDTLEIGFNFLYTPWVDLPAEGQHTVHLSVEWDAQTWNAGGNICLWRYGAVEVEGPPHDRPSILALHIAPNPANPTFVITFELPATGPTLLELYDLRGRRVRTLVDGHRAAGSHRETVDLGPTASGLHFVRLVTPSGQRVEKVLVLR